MKKRNLIIESLSLIFLIIPFIYLSSVYKDWPVFVPTHWNLKGEADVYGDKQNILWSALIVSAFIYGIMTLLNSNLFGFKRTESQRLIFDKLKLSMCLVIAFMCLAIFWIISHDSKSTFLSGPRIIALIAGASMILFGNLMYSLKPNPFFGFRTERILGNEYIWRKTHQFAGKLQVGTGAIVLLLSFAISNPLMIAGALGGTSVFATLIYAYCIKAPSTELPTP